MGGGVENVEDKLVSYIEKLRAKGTDQNAYLKQIFSSVRWDPRAHVTRARRTTSPSSCHTRTAGTTNHHPPSPPPPSPLQMDVNGDGQLDAFEVRTATAPPPLPTHTTTHALNSPPPPPPRPPPVRRRPYERSSEHASWRAALPLTWTRSKSSSRSTTLMATVREGTDHRPQHSNTICDPAPTYAANS